MSSRKNIELLSASVKRFIDQYNSKQPQLQKVANSYKDDFSLLCKQEYVNTLGIFAPAQKEIRTLLGEIINDESDDIVIDSQSMEQIEAIYDNLGNYDFAKLTIEYVNACNVFINFFKLPFINTFEKRKQIAMPVLKKWEEFMKTVNCFIDEVRNIGKVFNKIQGEEGE